jgi:DNA-binding HxlR family transcriptional regulator
MTKEEIFEKQPLIKLNNKIFACPTSAAMELIGGKWKSVILSHLMNGKKRYNELRKEIPMISERTLSIQLKQLESDGLIKRKAYTKKPPLRVEYCLSPFGETLVPLLKIIINWGVEAAQEKGEFIIE